MFKNLVLYTLPSPWENNLDEIEALLAKKAFYPCPSNVGLSVGFVPHGEEGNFVVKFGGHYLLNLLTETRVLPGKAINLHAQKLAKVFEEREGFPPGRKQMRELKEMALQELLPNAPIVQSSTRIWIDPAKGLIAIEASSQKKGEDAIQVLFRAMDHLPVKKFATNISPASWMAQLLLDKGSDTFSVDNSCALQGEGGAAVSYKNHTLSDESVFKQLQSHLSEGKQVTQVALTWNHRVSFVLTAKMEIKSIAFLDGFDESGESEEDAMALHLILANATAEVIQSLVEAMGGYQAEKEV